MQSLLFSMKVCVEGISEKETVASSKYMGRVSRPDA
ncbi:unnamed protein product [Rhodiola kirilowii]